ncbi:hypothetical protein L1987_55892 [Smallanthus sonchifolius]|uniref:Uncharacterized protein n=1 Tax=Smallanthus sonchifolius TaxID=185202 RepID=A0ACB9EAX5_9ASTR|nr:hypothetical protein L1987_55892 [Smallanthus sonchifolius]
MASDDTTVKPSAPPPENNGSTGPVVIDVGLRFLLFATALVSVIVMVTSKQTKLFPVPMLPGLPGLSIAIVAKFNQSPAFIKAAKTPLMWQCGLGNSAQVASRLFMESLERKSKTFSRRSRTCIVRYLNMQDSKRVCLRPQRIALSVACLYSIITGVLSIFVLMKPGGNFTKLQFHLVILDVLLFGIVAAAMGAAGGVGYIGFRGNSHTDWHKVCDNFGSFCSHFAASIFLSLISSITLLLLVWLSVYALSKKITLK